MLEHRTLSGMFGVKISGIGSSVPNCIVSNADLQKIVNTSDEWIYSRTGIMERHIAQPGESTVSLAITAAIDALAFAGVSADDIDLVIVSTTTPDRMYSSVACEVQFAIGAKHAGAFDIRAACSGFVYALSIGTQFIRSGNYRRVLVVAAETTSRFLDWTDRNTCVIFGDGAGAMLLERSESSNDILSTVLGSDGSRGMLVQLENRGSSHYPVNDKVQQATTRMDGRATYEFAVKTMPEAVLKACELAKISVAELDYLVPHQANQRIINSGAERLKIDGSRVISYIDRYGNTSSASIPIALTDALTKRTALSSPLICALVGFGAGLTWGAAVIRFDAFDKRRIAA